MYSAKLFADLAAVRWWCHLAGAVIHNEVLLAAFGRPLLLKVSPRCVDIPVWEVINLIIDKCGTIMVRRGEGGG